MNLDGEISSTRLTAAASGGDPVKSLFKQVACCSADGVTDHLPSENGPVVTQ